MAFRGRSVAIDRMKKWFSCLNRCSFFCQMLAILFLVIPCTPIFEPRSIRVWVYFPVNDSGLVALHTDLSKEHQKGVEYVASLRGSLSNAQAYQMSLNKSNRRNKLLLSPRHIGRSLQRVSLSMAAERWISNFSLPLFIFNHITCLTSNLRWNHHHR